MDSRAAYLYRRLSKLTPEGAFILGKYLGNPLDDREFTQVFNQELQKEYLHWLTAITQMKIPEGTLTLHLRDTLSKYYPPKYYPLEHQLLDLLLKYPTNKQIFIEEYREVEGHILSKLKQSSWLAELREQPVDDLLQGKRRRMMTNYYRPENADKEFYSLDLKQAACVILFLKATTNIPFDLYPSREELLDKFQWTDILSAVWSDDLPRSEYWKEIFFLSKGIREKIMGELNTLFMTEKCTVGRYYETLLQEVMTSVADLQPPQSVVWIFGDELILNQPPVYPEGWLAKRFKECKFTLKVHQLSNKKHFYVRESTLKMVDFQHRLEALRIAGLSHD